MSQHEQEDRAQPGRWLERITFALVLAVIVAVAIALALPAVLDKREITAVPDRPAGSSTGQTLTLQFPSEKPVESAPAKPVQNTQEPAPAPAAVPEGGRSRAPEPARISDETYGPPERVQTVAERAIKALLTGEGAEDDVTAVRAALADVRSGRIAAGLRRADAMTSSGARKLVKWYAFRSFGSRIRAEWIEAFRIANPDWPESELLRRRAEENLFLGNASTSDIHAFFKTSQPESAAGQAALARAERADGKTEEARKRIAAAWREGAFNATIENRVLARFKPLISEADHKWRLDRYLLDDNRYGRKGRHAVIRRMIGRLGPEEAEKARARLQIWRSYY
ncbi:MAG: hypothetical protein ACR2O4_11060, partial [Hyphomicrobiaceae bacterium]